MSRKDYELLARVIAADSSVEYSFAWSLAVALKADNPRFDTARFLKACGFLKEKVTL